MIVLAQASGTRRRPCDCLSFTVVPTAFLQFHAYGSYELAGLRRGADKIPFVASDVEKNGDAAVGFGARCRIATKHGRSRLPMKTRR